MTVLIVWLAAGLAVGLVARWSWRPLTHGLAIAFLTAIGLFGLLRDGDVIGFGVCVLVAIDYIHEYNEIVSERRKQSNGSEC